MTKFKNTFRIESARLKDWDYSTPWWYYITINTKDQIEYFGQVVMSKIELNELGKIVESEWLKTKEIRSNIELDYYVVMPNHIHGIIIINGPEVETHRVRLTNRDCYKGDAFDASLRIVRNGLSDVIRGFKSAVTKSLRLLGYSTFSWQPRFYDRIIRNEKELFNIRRYIEQNPLKWELDNFDPENIFNF
jgi:putative transposase